jgi:UDP-MurNAc hydroxylase
VKPVITHLGHAGFFVDGAHGVLLMDPWFNPALLESWFPWPDNSHLRDDAYGNWVYVSHHHEDHFDAQFLRRVLAGNPGAQLIVPRFRSRRMERLWKSIGAKRAQMHVLGHGGRLEIGPGVTVTMLLDRSHKEDSALLLDHQGYRFLNMNDCELAIPDIPQADALASQFSGAFWYPQCYTYERLDYERKAAEVVENNIERLYRKMMASQAEMYYPSAGPAAFLDISLRQYNSGESLGGIFPEWRDVEGQFLKKFPRARIGDHLPVVESVHAYADRRRDEWEKFKDRDNTPATPAELQAHFDTLMFSNKALLKDYQKDVRFHTYKGDWSVRVGIIGYELEETFDPEYFVLMPRRVMRAVINGDATWETALSSMRCTLHRYPDEYDFTLMSLLSFGDEPAITREIARARRSAQSEMIERNGYQFQRWCPHAGEDLSGASIDVSGSITCPRHGWCWSLETGECLNQDKRVTLRTRRTG